MEFLQILELKIHVFLATNIKKKKVELGEHKSCHYFVT